MVKLHSRFFRAQLATAQLARFVRRNSLYCTKVASTSSSHRSSTTSQCTTYPVRVAPDDVSITVHWIQSSTPFKSDASSNSFQRFDKKLLCERLWGSPSAVAGRVLSRCVNCSKARVAQPQSESASESESESELR